MTVSFGGSGSSKMSRFNSNWLKWQKVGDRRGFRFVAVEPREFAVERHPETFYAVLDHLLGSSGAVEYREFVGSSTPTRLERFDLVTFPEAFLPSKTLVEFVNYLAPRKLIEMGCIHVGLRPSTGDTHLFTVLELSELIDQLTSVKELVAEDLVSFGTWLERQPSDARLNVGCLLSVDVSGRVRACLHPKLVRSTYESSGVAEEHMTEGTLLSLVTLLPDDSACPQVTIQPLICSDVFYHGTDRSRGGGLEGVTLHSSCFDEQIPEHVDVVSVVTCTPTRERKHHWGSSLEWRQAFRDSFVRSAKDGLYRWAAFVLSNYRIFPGTAAPRPGGLSGAFVPFSDIKGGYPDCISLSVYARSDDPGQEEEAWMSHAEALKLDPKSRVLGFLAMLEPCATNVVAVTLVQMQLQRLPRLASSWNRDGKLVEVSAFDFHPTNGSNEASGGPQYKIVQRGKA